MIFREIKESNTFYFKPFKGIYYTLNANRSPYKIRYYPSWNYKKSLDKGANVILAPNLIGAWQDD